MTAAVETFTGNNGDTAPSPWLLATLSGAQDIQSNKWQIRSGVSNAGTGITYGTTTYTDVEVSVELTLDSGGAEQYPALAARMGAGGTNGWGSFAEPAGYEVYLDTNTDLMHLTVAMLGGLIDDTHTTPLTLTAGLVIKIRLQCVGTTIRAKAWDTAGAEPGYWMISFTDTTYTSGTVGFRDQVAASGTRSDWDNFVVDDQPLGAYKVQTVGTQVTNAAALTTVINYAGSVKPQVGDFVVMYGSRDNTATDPLTDTFTDSDSNTWNVVGPLGSNTGTALAGLVGVAFWSKITTPWAAGTNVLTWNHPSTKAAMVVEHWRGLSDFRGSATAQSTAGAPSAALAGVLRGDAVLAMEALEYSSAGTSTGDADTTNGLWSTFLGPTATTGTTLAAVKVISQYKIVSADGTQTYNPTHSVTTNVSAVAIVMAFIPIQYNTSRYLPRGDAVRRAATW